MYTHIRISSGATILLAFICALACAAALLYFAPNAQADTTLGPNLIANPSLEDGTNTPTDWIKGGYGTNTRAYAYPATPAEDGSRAAEVSITSYTSGDAKWYFDPVAIQGGATYEFSDWYESNVPSEIDAQVTHTNGSTSYIVLGKPAASASYAEYSATFAVPADAAKVTVFHVIDQVGQITVDNYSLNQATEVQSNNLVPNADLEEGTGSAPTDWIKGGWGTNTRTYTYPATGVGGSKAAEVAISSYASGDAKWYFDPVAVTGGATYDFSDEYTSNVQSEVDVQVTHTNGSTSYIVLGKPAASANYKEFSASFTVPSDAAKVTVFHVINHVGTLTVDNYSLTAGTQPPPPPPSNLVPNPDFEEGSANAPASWSKGGWGTNTRVFSYPVTGVGGSKAAQVSITSYTSGDAKWYFDPLSLSPGIYTYSSEYESNTPSILELQVENADGSYTYTDLATLPSASSFTSASAQFTVPNGAQNVTVYQLIQSVGSLTIDNVSLTETSAFKGIFLTGAVSLRFDDGWQSQYDNALPAMRAAGFPGTFFIISQQIADDDYAGFVSKAEVQQMYVDGEEIGAHTRTHPYLSQESQADQWNEINGSRQDILSWNVGPVLSFAYPYGDYSSTTVSLVQQAGFADAASTNGGYTAPTTDPYLLKDEEVDASTTLAQVEQWIQGAQSQKLWLILTFHEVTSPCPEYYCTTPTEFDQIIQYLQSVAMPVVTISQGMQSMVSQ